ncbi:hypothetical protein [Thermanaeromonas toyohensis]|nr:hypothetical protein [Thermanaeromonas toyohensis]
MAVCSRGFQGPELEEHPGVGPGPAANVVPSSPCPSGPAPRLVIARP